MGDGGFESRAEQAAVESAHRGFNVVAGLKPEFRTNARLFERPGCGGEVLTQDRQERLVQLFPEAFWSETSIALAVVILIAALWVTWLAVRRLEAPSQARRRAEQGREVIA